MNVGGFHIFGGLFFLILCGLITYCYVIILYLAIVTLKCLVFKAPEYWVNVKKKFLAKSFVVVMLAISALYLTQRIIWMGKDNTHYEAKEYFVAGEVIAGHKRILGRFLHPERFIIKPYDYLLEKVYETGRKHLPDDDGEKHVWYNRWFLSLYSHSDDVRPLGIGNDKYEPKMVKLLDSYWETLKGMMDNPIRDKQMYKEYLLQFPFSVDYYSTFQGHYTGPFYLHGVRTRNHPVYRKRNIQLLEWLDVIYRKWEEEKLVAVIWKKYPYVAAIRQYSLNELTQRICISLPRAGEFSCEHPMMLRMKKEFEVSMSSDARINPILNLKKTNAKQAKFTYQNAIYHGTGQAGYYLIHHVCREEMPKESYLLVGKAGVYNEFDDYKWTEQYFETDFAIFIKQNKGVKK